MKKNNMVDYSSNSYFAVSAKGTSDKMKSEVDQLIHGVKPKEEARKIDPHIKYDKFIRTDDTGDKVFFIENGNAHWIKDPETLFALGGDFGKVINVAYEVLKTLNLKCEVLNIQNAGNYVVEKKPVEVQNVEEGGEREKNAIELTNEMIDACKNEAQSSPAAPDISSQAISTEKKDQKVVDLPRKEGLLSIIVVLAEFDNDFLAKVKERVEAFIKKLEAPIPHVKLNYSWYEIVIVANGTDKSPQDVLFNYGHKVVIVPKQEDFFDAVNRGVRISQGQFNLLFL